MNYEELSGKSVLLLGKTRALNVQEFETLLKLHKITLSNRFEEGIALIIEGRLMNPLEQEESARLYERRAAESISIEPFEEWLCRSIEPNRLLMSLKLSKDQERLVDFIQNPYITDELFFKLLKLYDWQGEGLFDNDRNRDVTAALIGRFYRDLDKNHNVQYAMSGLAHLIERYGTAELIGAVVELSPIAKEIKNPQERSLSGVLDAIALHSETPENILRSLLAERGRLLAQRTPLSLETELMQDETLHPLLAKNRTLSEEGSLRLLSRYGEILAAHRELDEVWFDRLSETYPAALAANPTLDEEMQGKLFQKGEDEVSRVLASNAAVNAQRLESLYRSGKYHPELASNHSLPPKYLEVLFQSGDGDILDALASNTNTPIDILYQLSLDRRFERSVKTNPSFGKHIQTHNIGWN